MVRVKKNFEIRGTMGGYAGSQNRESDQKEEGKRLAVIHIEAGKEDYETP